MNECECPLEKFRQLPLPLLMLTIGAKAVFSFGLGAMLAAPKKSCWHGAGCAMMTIGTLMAIPSVVAVLRDCKREGGE